MTLTLSGADGLLDGMAVPQTAFPASTLHQRKRWSEQSEMGGQARHCSFLVMPMQVTSVWPHGMCGWLTTTGWQALTICPLPINSLPLFGRRRGRGGDVGRLNGDLQGSMEDCILLGWAKGDWAECLEWNAPIRAVVCLFLGTMVGWGKDLRHGRDQLIH